MRQLLSPLLLLCLLSFAATAQPTTTTQSGDLQIASLEQAYDSQIIQILSNHFDRKKFFVDVNIDAEFIEETYQTRGNQVVNRTNQNVFMPGLPFLPEENLQNTQSSTQSPEEVVNQNTYKSLKLNNIAVNIYADTSLSDTDLDFMRRVTGFAAKVDYVRGDVINITQLAIPNPSFEPTVVISTEDPEPKDLLTSFKDYLVEIILLGVFFLGLAVYGFYRKPANQQNTPSQRDSFKSDVILDGSLNQDSNLSFHGSTKEKSQDIASEFELVSENFFKYPQEVALVFEFWIDSDEKNGPANVAEVISAIDRSSLRLIENHIAEEKLEVITRALAGLRPMSIDEKYRAAKYFNSIIENEETDAKSTKKHAKLGLFKFLTHLPDDTISELIKTENNVSAALIIDYLPQEKAASILNSFERSRAAEIMLKMSTLHTLSYNEQSKISNGLFEKAIVVRDNVQQEDYGVENIIPILENLPVNEQKRYIEQLKLTGSPIGDILEKEFFTIDQIPELDEEVIKNGIASIDTTTLLEALIGLDRDSIEKLLITRPKREQQLIRLELEALNGDTVGSSEAKFTLVKALRKSIKLSKADQE
tara:strand:+ start:6624 stop:8393 length:1770 start_codon:yes stop_codon:yes gene_type:complete